MNKDERKFVFFLLIVIIIFSVFFIYKVKSGSKYDKNLYNEIYSEYEELFNNKKVNENTNMDNNKSENEIYLKMDSKGNKFRVAGKITIPKINIQYPIIYETSEQYLKIAPTKLFGPDVNTVGNLCVVGHNYKNNEFFSRLSELEKRDKIYLTPNRGKDMIYLVYDKFEIDENDMECTSQDTKGNIELTLITCTKNKKKRLVVKSKATI